MSAIHARVTETLRAKGHDVDDLDLYAEKFDPVLSHKQLTNYVKADANTCGVESYVARLRAADALVLVYPVWYDGLPAILQGYFQRVFVPGVSTIIDSDRRFHPNLWNLKRMATVCSYGEPRRDVAAKNDPARRFVRDNIGALIDPNGRFEYVALYGMDFVKPVRRAAFLRWVERAFGAW